MADSEVAVCNLALTNIGDTEGFIATLDDPSTQAVVCKLQYAHCRDVALRAFKWPFAKRRAYPAMLGGSTWATGTAYAIGQYVSYNPDDSLLSAPPEFLSAFVYVSLGPQGAVTNQGKIPDQNPTFWRQISRAEWAYCYQLPSDAVELRGLYHHDIRNPREDQKIPFEIGYEPAPGPGQILFTDGCLPWETPLGSMTNPPPIALDYTARVTDPQQFPEDFTAALAWALAVKLFLALRKDPAAAKAANDMYMQALAEAKVTSMKGQQREPLPIPSQIAARMPRGGIRWR